MSDGFVKIVPPPWGYQSDPPYRVIAGELPNDNLLALHYFDTLTEATAHFVRFHVGPIPLRSVGIVDVNDQLILGYRAMMWFGTAAAFAELARHHDPMTVAVWESQSCGGDDPYEVPEEPAWNSR